jgi:hypothetical protein
MCAKNWSSAVTRLPFMMLDLGPSKLFVLLSQDSFLSTLRLSSGGLFDFQTLISNCRAGPRSISTAILLSFLVIYSFDLPVSFVTFAFLYRKNVASLALLT